MSLDNNKLTIENLSSHEVPVLRTYYNVNLNGDIINRTTRQVLKSDYSQGGRRNTRIIIRERQFRRKLKRGLKIRRKYSVISNARFMIETFFSIQFNYRIFYIDGDKTNTHITNLMIKDTMQRYITRDYEPTYVRLADYLPLVIKNIEYYNKYQTILYRVVLELK